MHLLLQALNNNHRLLGLFFGKATKGSLFIYKNDSSTQKESSVSRISKCSIILLTCFFTISCNSSKPAAVVDRSINRTNTASLPPSTTQQPNSEVFSQPTGTPLEDRRITNQSSGINQNLPQTNPSSTFNSPDLNTVDGKLEAAERHIQAQNYLSAEQTITGLTASRVSSQQRDRLAIVNAYIQFQRQDYNATLDTIDPLIGNLVPNTRPGYDKVTSPTAPDLALTPQQVDALLLASFCYQKLNNYDSAIATLIRRENALVGNARSETTRYIWQVIETLTPEQRQQLIQTTQNPLVRNRVEQSLQGEVSQSVIAPQQFTQLSPSSVNPLEQQQAVASNWNASSAKNIAVLLPLSSKFNKAAQAVLDGIKYQNNLNSSAYRPQIQVYDIGQNSTQANQYYNAAINSGADFVIGPLGKDYADQVASFSGSRAPTILLGGDYPVQGSTVRFSMSPESQGIQVAKRAQQDGHITATILAPNTLTNQRIIDAFKSYWLQTGGKISSVVSYDQSQFDHSNELKQLFDIGSSETRYAQLSNTLSFKPKFNPYQRSDIDFVFMLANNESGRIVRPQINFFSNSKIPVYSTSTIFNGVPNKTENIDLDNTLFPIMPWVYKSKDSASYGGQLNELFAMGADAYEVAGNFQSLRSNSNVAINANTGRVSINSNSELYTQPLWAKFVDGEPTLVETYGIDVSPTNVSGPQNYGAFGSQRTSTGKGVYNDKTWDTGESRRKTSP